MDEVRAPGRAVAWHQEAHRSGWVRDGMKRGMGQVGVGGENARFMLMSDVVEHVDDAALVDLRGVACYEDVDG